MQFSLRRMLLAVALFAATVGTLTLYAKRLGTFRSDNDSTSWWAAVIAAALAVSGMLLVGPWRDLARIVNAAVWTILGYFAGAMLQGSYLLFIFLGRIGPHTDILKALIGWSIGSFLLCRRIAGFLAWFLLPCRLCPSNTSQ